MELIVPCLCPLLPDSPPVANVNKKKKKFPLAQLLLPQMTVFLLIITISIVFSHCFIRIQ